MTASRVPSSRLGRLFHYGGLASGMAWGAATESLKRATGMGDANPNGGVMLSPANVNRLVKKLSRMRGAALKLGQMMSFQDKMLPPAIHEVLARVQDSADYMPASQRDSVLAANLGPNWRTLFSSFSELPMAAASIGQVHAATLASTGLPVAVKVQYPGVASSISSDLSNLAVLLTASRLLPKGLYLDKTIANARTELGWECDYIREGECAKRFAELLKEDTVFRVPQIIDEACGPQVLTMERMWGVGVTKVLDTLTQEERDWIGGQVLRLCFREVREFRFMQTDPNWTNFLWNKEDQKVTPSLPRPQPFTDNALPDCRLSYLTLAPPASMTPPSSTSTVPSSPPPPATISPLSRSSLRASAISQASSQIPCSKHTLVRSWPLQNHSAGLHQTCTTSETRR